METKLYDDGGVKSRQSSPPSSPMSEHSGSPVRSPAESTPLEVGATRYGEKGKSGIRHGLEKQETSSVGSEVR